MNAGDYIHRVTVQRRTEVSDGHDGVVEDWTLDVGPSRIAAKVQTLSGRDLERARQIDPQVSYLLTLRFYRTYGDDFDGGRARVVWHDDGALGDRTLEIVEPPRELVPRLTLGMLCKELR